MSTETKAAAPGENRQRRDLLLKIQEESQKLWQAERLFEIDAPAVTDTAAIARGKFFGNFPYPYMNGLLHLGHAFSLSKLEFASAYHRLSGKNVLFPQGFHCTGMPIKACADKLRRELEVYGNPPKFPLADEHDDTEDDSTTTTTTPPPPPPPVDGGAKVDPTKFTAKKSKAAAKKGPGATQYEILTSSGIPSDLIHKFTDPNYWLEYFPPLAQRDMSAMGCGIDWRRSFITTDVNPYYDSFIKWQFNTLRKQNKVVKDKRYTIYSPLDKQPCADHDRASGEGVVPQEYVLIKMKVLALPDKLTHVCGGKEVFFMAATLRPETMFGQTNCWVLPEGEYVCVEGLNNEAYVLTERAAKNLSYQDCLPTWGSVNILAHLSGQELIGTPLSAPYCPHERIYALPMLTILTNKGTGVVTSVPSDSPDDYRALLDLKEKAKLREKYYVKDEWVMPFNVLPIIDIPGLGSESARVVCEELKIASQNDAKALAEAKAKTYLKGFTDGVMIVKNEYQGRKVSEVKPIIKQLLIDAKLAMLYSEPEKLVTSRSGDECVVALTDQWYIIYGDAEWRRATETCLARLECYHDEVKNAFHGTLEWLSQWACSRSFGLGTRLPWDPQYLIESLSDSTIYMAFYTVSHLLQQGDMYGRSASTISANVLQDEFWDYLFLDGAMPTLPGISPDSLQKMRREFEYWYPFDLRVSGKDLIQNHLTFSLYTHTAMFPESRWPRAMRCNGHLLLNSEKMSKSTGNFKTLEQAIREYSADAMRLALADAGDSVEDANFEEAVANAAILRLTKEMGFMEEIMSSPPARTGPPSCFADRVFANALSTAVHATRDAYEKLSFREALKLGWFDMQNARDAYRVACASEGGMNASLLEQYMHIETRLVAPIVPHTAEHMWRVVLKRSGSVFKAGWPDVPAPDAVLTQAAKYLDDQVSMQRRAIAKWEMAAKKKAPAGSVPKVGGATFVVKKEYTGWHAAALHLFRQAYDETTKTYAPDLDAKLMALQHADLDALNEKQKKGVLMPFMKQRKELASTVGVAAFDVRMQFDEESVLRENVAYLLRSLSLDAIEVEVAGGEGEAVPGNPLVVLRKAE